MGASVATEAGRGQDSDAGPPTLTDLAAAFPQLEIISLIGQGGMGFVYKARQPHLDRFVALKILPLSLAADPAFSERFAREARVLARLNHPNIVTIHDFGQAGGYFYLLIEFVDGVNLRQALRTSRLEPETALSIVPKICDALQFAHNEGILHRDIKPENIMLDSRGRVKIADFGIAKLMGETATGSTLPRSDEVSGTGEGRAGGGRPNITEIGRVLGTPQYMAPEQISAPNSVDHRADIYSLGVVFYEMLTGELPLGQFAPPSQKSKADPRLDEVVNRTLEKEPDRRTQSAGEVKTQVESITTSHRPPPMPEALVAGRAPPRSGLDTSSPFSPVKSTLLRPNVLLLAGALIFFATIAGFLAFHFANPRPSAVDSPPASTLGMRSPVLPSAPPIPPAAPQPPAPTDLVSWWPADGTADDAAGSNNGELMHGASYAPGKVGQAFNFNGYGQYLEVPPSPSLDLTGSFTLECWIFPTLPGGAIMGKWSDTGDYLETRSYVIDLTLTRAFQFGIADATHQYDQPYHIFNSADGLIPLNQWTHVAAVYDQVTGTRILYVNGDRVASRTDPPIRVLRASTKFCIGARMLDSTRATDFFTGRVDEASVYDRALSAGEISAIYNAGSAGKQRTPIASAHR